MWSGHGCLESMFMLTASFCMHATFASLLYIPNGQLSIFSPVGMPKKGIDLKIL